MRKNNREIMNTQKTDKMMLKKEEGTNDKEARSTEMLQEGRGQKMMHLSQQICMKSKIE